MFSFFAVPILLGDITIDFMQMIDVMVDVMVTATGEEGEGTGNNNNNNNNNGEGAEGECESTGNNNNCNNNNNRSVLLLGHISFCDIMVTKAGVFYKVKNGSSFIMSKSSTKNLSNENKRWCFCCLKDKM